MKAWSWKNSIGQDMDEFQESFLRIIPKNAQETTDFRGLVKVSQRKCICSYWYFPRQPSDGNSRRLRHYHKNLHGKRVVSVFQRQLFR